MKNKVYILVILILLAAFVFPAMAVEPAGSSEYQIKAAFIYNFMKFIEWPKETIGKEDGDENSKEPKADDKEDEPIVIGVVGDNPFGKAFEPIMKKKINGRKLVIQEFECIEKYKAKAKNKAKYKEEYMAEYGKALKKCHVLFFHAHAAKDHNCHDIVELLGDSGVLTVGDMKNFAAKGGIIGFVIEKKKVRFEVNLTAAERANLKISSKLLRLAKRVIEEKKTTEEQR